MLHTWLMVFSSVSGGLLCEKIQNTLYSNSNGMMTPWALNEKRIKKKIYWTLFEKHNLYQAAAIHALTNTEKQYILKTVGKKRMFL